MRHITQPQNTTWSEDLATPNAAAYSREDLSLLTAKWIAIEGIDAVGKSTQVAALNTICKRLNLPTRVIAEFSSSPVGQTLQQIISEQRFYSLEKDRRTPVADTIILLGDLIYSLEISSYSKEPAILFSDRGLLSLLAYQARRLSQTKSTLSTEEATKLIKAIAELAFSQIKPPDLSVLLTLPAATVQKRVQCRGEEPLSETQLRFLIEIQNLFGGLAAKLPAVVIDASELSIEQTSQAILDASLNYFRGKK